MDLKDLKELRFKAIEDITKICMNRIVDQYSNKQDPQLLEYIKEVDEVLKNLIMNILEGVLNG
jgi:hypothetical protein